MRHVGQFLHPGFLQAFGVTFGPHSFFFQGAGPNTNIPWYSLVWCLAYKLLWRTGHARHNNSNVSDPRHWHTPCDLCWGVITFVRGFQWFLSKLPSRYWSWEYPWTEIFLHFSFPVREKHLQLAPAQLRNSLQTAGYHVSGPGETRHLSTAFQDTSFLCWDSSRSGVHKGSEDRPLHGWQMHHSDHIWNASIKVLAPGHFVEPHT